MKKNYFYLFLAIPIIALVLTSSSGGRTDGRTGSPGDGPVTCSGCHSGGTLNASLAITTNIPAGGYALNTQYNITVTLTSSPNSTASGFQATSEKSGGTKVGTFGAGVGSQTINSNKGVTHTGTGQKVWSFTWTSPATNEGTLTFYASAIAANGNGGTSGDQVVTTSTPINALSNESFGLATFKLFPNPTTDNITVELPQGYTQVYASIVDVMGKTILNKEISDINNNINVASLSPGTYILSLSNEEGSTTKTFVKK